jgi:hypothetical protein
MLRRKRLVAAVAVAAGLALMAGLWLPVLATSPWQSADGAFLSGNSKTNCVYPATSQTLLAQFSAATKTTFNCVVLFNNAKPEWSDWVNVWFAHPPTPDMNFVQWKNAVPGRRLIISQPMVPDDVPANWRELGAEGDYDQYATQLATTLVAEGLGDSIIRLGWEANSSSADPESALGTDPSQYQDWAIYWARIVRAMRAVPGADFLFDWTVNQYDQPIPLDSWYPGDDVVDIIGIDAYDSGIDNTALSPAQRWEQLSNEPDGLNAVAAFAQAHGKPMSIPEWGLVPTGAQGGAGDDPAYVAGIASFIANNDVIYSSYFEHPGEPNVIPLTDAPNSLVTYQQDIAHSTPPPPGPSQILLTDAQGQVSAVTAFGTSTIGQPINGLNQPIEGIAATSDANGYWLVASDGGIFSYGDAPFLGSMGGSHLNRPIVGMTADDQTGGYWLVASDGGVFAFDAPFEGSMGGAPLNRPIVGMAFDPVTGGYWLVASDGGVFAFDAPFEGSMGGTPLNRPIVGIVGTPDGNGYWLVASDGGVFAFGDAGFAGSQVPGTAVSIVTDTSGAGYWIVSASGAVTPFGDAWIPLSTNPVTVGAAA